MQVDSDHVDMIMIKGKRSKRPRPPSPLALTMATSSSSTAGCDGFGFSSGDGVITSSDDRLASSPETISEELLITHSSDDEEEDMAKCLILLATGRVKNPSSRPLAAAAAGKGSPVEVYQCKTCDKSFPSFQALGGHRASHKKPNRPTTVDDRPNNKSGKQEDFRSISIGDENTMLSLQISTRPCVGGSGGESKSRVHECSICGAEFSSGQALGGHMRRHRPIPPPGSGVLGQPSHVQVKKPRNVLSLDLNLPAPEEDLQIPESKFGFGHKEQVIVFSASPLVDCHY